MWLPEWAEKCHRYLAWSPEARLCPCPRFGHRCRMRSRASRCLSREPSSRALGRGLIPIWGFQDCAQKSVCLFPCVGWMSSVCAGVPPSKSLQPSPMGVRSRQVPSCGEEQPWPRGDAGTGRDPVELSMADGVHAAQPAPAPASPQPRGPARCCQPSSEWLPPSLAAGAS